MSILPFNEKMIHCKIGHLKYPGVICGDVATAVIKKLLGEKYDKVTGCEAQSIEETVKVIKEKIGSYGLVPIWFDSGLYSPPATRGYHFLIVFNVDPLESFTFWDPSGYEAFNEAKTIDYIRGTFVHRNYLDVNDIKEVS